ncbi:AEC family transporter, partial [Lysinibacillus telephonicus]|uniref:AEC family transporter n=1 Tax=Lysinibacillus telephonicus TaxID=1714840 RepID=UPI00397ACCFE
PHSEFLACSVGSEICIRASFYIGLDGVVAQSLLIASSFPTSRNSSSLALEYDIESNTAAQTVLFSTIVSCLTVTFVIYLSTMLFG